MRSGTGRSDPERLALRRVALAVTLVLLSVPGSAHAAFPGANGRIAYAVGGGASVVSRSWLETVRPDGSAKRRIDVAADAPAFSPGGRRIAFGDPFSARLLSMTPRGTRIRRLTHEENSEFDGSADWSPSGRRLVFVRAHFGRTVTDVWIHSAHEDRLLLRDASDPAWSVNGDIAVTSSAGRPAGIYVVRPDGSRLVQVSPRGSTPDWSPDGRRIVFRVGSDIASIRSDGSGFRQLTRGPAFDSDPAFSPDGRRVAFVRNRGTLMRMSSSGRGVRRVAKPTTTESDGSAGIIQGPDWQPRP